MSTIKKFLIKIYETKCVDINTRVESLEIHCVQYKLNIRKIFAYLLPPWTLRNLWTLFAAWTLLSTRNSKIYIGPIFHRSKVKLKSSACVFG